MKLNEITQTKSFVFELFKQFEQCSLTYVYRGIFDYNLTGKILSLTETNMEMVGEVSKIQKKVYFVMVESLQNITRHQDLGQNEDNKAFFVVQTKNGKYEMASGNVIENNHIDSLKQKLDKINSLNPEDLKAYAKDILENGDLSEKGGAGLGLIEMAKRSGGKLAYDFTALNNHQSYFYFKSKIAGEPEIIETNNLDDVKELHKLTKENHINMVYQGLFTHENLKSLLIMTEGSVASKEVPLKRKAVNVMVELLQNICNHGVSEFPEKLGIPGILVVTTNSTHCTISSGNYISDMNVESIQTKMDTVNACNPEELEDMYTNQILKEDIPGQKGAGLGFIDIRMKSFSKIDYSIVKINPNFSFISVSISIPL